MYYDSFMLLNQSPKEQIIDQMQESVNETFEVASTYQDDIYQEIEFGSLSFQKIQARITNLVDSKTGEKIQDDFKKIVFPDLSFTPILGSRYKFSDNIWIVVSTGNIKSVTSSAYLRRCNNTINTLDKYGNLHEEPCYLEYKPSKSSVVEKDLISILDNRQTLCCQLNQWTRNININTRILFNSTSYKVSDKIQLNRTETFNKDSVLLSKFYIENDNKNDYDNIELGVADYIMPKYSISVQDSLNGLVGSTNTITYQVLLDNIEVEENVNWYSENTEIVSIDKYTGEYELLQQGTTLIKAKLRNNEYYYSSIKVQVTEESVDIYENHITPLVETIAINKEQEYSVYETLNNEITDTQFSIAVSGMPQTYYNLRVEGNTFYIKNRKINENNLLKVICTNLRDSSEIILHIELGGIF